MHFEEMRGAYSALFTPYTKDNRINTEMIGRLVEHQLAGGLRGFFVGGTTGESMLLTLDERKLVLETVVAANRGRGKVIAAGFFPAISYIATSERPAGADYSTLDFQAVHRQWMRKVLEEGGVRPRLATDNYRVEANWIQSPEADLVALSNWTGCEQTITLELARPPAYREIRAIAGKILSKEPGGEALRLRVTCAAGDWILLNH